MSEEGKEAYEELGPRILQNWHGLASLHMCESCRRPVNIEDDTSDAIKVSVMGIQRTAGVVQNKRATHQVICLYWIVSSDNSKQCSLPK